MREIVLEARAVTRTYGTGTGYDDFHNVLRMYIRCIGNGIDDCVNVSTGYMA